MGSASAVEADDVYTIAPEGSLTISNVQTIHEGTYTCVVENAMGRIEASADIWLVGECRSNILFNYDSKFGLFCNNKRRLNCKEVYDDVNVCFSLT